MYSTSFFRLGKLPSLLLLSCCFTLFITACQKHADVAADKLADKEQASQTLKDHLNNLKKTAGDEGQQQVDKLLAGINFSGLWIEKAAKGNLVIAAPLTASFETTARLTGQHAKYIALLVNPAGEVLKRNIFVHVPGAPNTSLPDQLFTNVFENKRFSLTDGGLIALSFGGGYKYDLQFENGKLKSRSTPLKKETAKKTGTATESDGGLSPYCIDWYRVRIYYDEDGNEINRDEEYIGQTCYGCGQSTPFGQTEQCDYIDDEPHMGGGGEPEGYDALKTMVWHVYNTSGGPVNATGAGTGVNSVEDIKGRRVASHPNGGYFKSAKHYTSTCNNCDNSTGGTYGETSATVTYTPDQVSSTVTGRYPDNGESKSIAGSRTWTFSQVF